MKYLLLALLLCVLTSLSDAHCEVKPQTPETQNETHCQDNFDLTWHVRGTTWRNSGCMECDCERCCSVYGVPTGFPDDCEAVFDEKACEYTVHKKDDPSVLCPVFHYSGK
ncbi:PREDICTED: beta-microseminoprotein A1-like [Cyprinodon variegatus]|uniref:beta-microseminoprotein A1-like n=1 Tax=Cyprinodon variegatus TaxID=28743 RepID=UPI000742B265|nr:PREDICTED: beta-microseminoprotein A1-like [Cyprinodon variegatus]